MIQHVRSRGTETAKTFNSNEKDRDTHPYTKVDSKFFKPNCSK